MVKKMRWLIGLGIAASLCGAGIAAANGGIKLVVDGKQIIPDVQPQNVNGRVMVPIRFISEALGAKVGWNGTTQTVSIDSQGKKSLETEVGQFIQGLAPTTPDEAVSLYMDGLQHRNGALQYAAFSDDLKQKALHDFEQMNWVTGTSSPWLASWKISRQTKIDENTIQFEIQTQYATSTGSLPVSYSSLSVVNQQGHWYVSSIGNDQTQGNHPSTEWELASKLYQTKGIVKSITKTSDKITSIILEVQQNLKGADSSVDDANFPFKVGSTVEILMQPDALEKYKPAVGEDLTLPVGQYDVDGSGQVQWGCEG